MQTELTGGPYPIDVDPGEFEQVVLNLVLNARDALPDGGTISVTTGAEEGMSQEGSLGPGMQLLVSDDGIGIKPAIRQRIFEPFYSTKPMGRGTGLGLSTVYGIVQRAGGSMDVQTAVGEGTSMRIWLPLTDEPVNVETSTRPTPAGGDETILFAEDDEQVMSLVSRTLTESGYRVLTASDGAEALEVFKRHARTIQLVVSDVAMPKLDGLELAEQLGKLKPGLPVIFISGYVDDTLISDALERRPDRVLLKPFSPQEVRTKVRRALDQATAR